MIKAVNDIDRIAKAVMIKANVSDKGGSIPRRVNVLFYLFLVSHMILIYKHIKQGILKTLKGFRMIPCINV